MPIEQIIIQIIISSLSGIIGVFVGGFITNKIKKDEFKLYEIATALSIIEELRVLKEEYEQEFDTIFEDVNKQQYLTTFYVITQDYTTIFTQNSGEIGLIKNKELRNLIIKCYICLKKFIEYLVIYNNKLNSFDKNRVEFIGRTYPNLINTACSDINYDAEILKIKNLVCQNNWSWFNTPFLNQPQVISFLNSDDILIQDLISASKDLKNKYKNLKNNIEITIQLANKIYNEN